MTTATATQVVNYALLQLGQELITDINQTANRSARMASQVYDITRQSLLRTHPWNFAVTRQTLAASTTAPDFEYSYKFGVPSDCIRILRVNEMYSGYKLENGYILTDSTELSLIYISDVTDVGRFDPLFIKCLSLKLALDLCFSLTGSETLKSGLNSQFEMAIKEAKQIDGQEDIHKLVFGDTWILSGMDEGN